MVYYKSWAEFHSAATALYAAQPERVSRGAWHEPGSAAQGHRCGQTDAMPGGGGESFDQRGRTARWMSRYETRGSEEGAAAAAVGVCACCAQHPIVRLAPHAHPPFPFPPPSQRSRMLPLDSVPDQSAPKHTKPSTQAD
jgi:hypothetical protein